MVGLGFPGSGFFRFGFWVVVASWNRHGSRNESRRDSGSLPRDRWRGDHHRQFDGPLACSGLDRLQRHRRFEAAGKTRSSSLDCSIHFCGGVGATTQKMDWVANVTGLPGGWRARRVRKHEA
jgi:hypothetical protein